MSTSRILQRLYSLDTSSPDFLRYLYCLIQYDEKEQYLTSLQGSELARLVNFLDKALGVIPTTDDVARECLDKLQAICGHHAILPSSYIVSDQIVRVDDGPISLGAVADVWEGTCRGKKVSIKSLRIRTENYQTIKQTFSKEAVIWKRLRHPNIVPFIGVTTDPLQIISEWMPNGTLTEFLEKNRGWSRIGLLSDVSEGLYYLHANHTMHGNLNGPSVLVDHDGHARLTDFEFASIVRGMNSATQVNGHTAAWTAPEILEGTDAITREADVFAFGMAVIEIFTGKPPFGESPTPVIISKIMGGERPARPQAQELGLADSLWDMTVHCWHQDPAQRPTMTEVVGLIRELLVASLSIEADLSDFFQACKTWGRDDQGEKAQEFADRLDEILDNADLREHKRKQYLRYLRRLCGTFDVLPSSFTLPPTSVNRDDAPFASGGYSTVYKATFHDRPVVIKVLNVATQSEREKLHRLLVKEVVGWKWLRHENVLPFVGVMFAPSPISIVSERMDNGNIMDFIKANQDYNRLRLLVGAVTGLEYLHENNIAHGDLKGVNILIDSECRARLADFGLAAIVDETSRTTAADNKLKGTTRWMAPELFFPDKFGFTGKLAKQLPSKETDIYAIGMTVLEVLTGCVPFADVARNETVIFKVMDGTRPNRPPSGLSDTLWELLVATWVVQHAQEPGGRPPASTVLDRLKEIVDEWGESIVPLVPEFWQEDSSDEDVTMGENTMASGFCDRIDHPVVGEWLNDLTPLVQSLRYSSTYSTARPGG